MSSQFTNKLKVFRCIMNAYDDSLRREGTKVTLGKLISLNKQIFKDASSFDMKRGSKEYGWFRRHQMGLVRNFQNGNFPLGPLPIGFKRDYTSYKRNQIIHNDDARVVIQIFNLRKNEKLSYEGISASLKQMGYRLTKNQVNRVLTNPFYTGVMEYDGIKYNGDFKPIISEELFKSVQILPRKMVYNEDEGGNFPLDGFVRIFEDESNGVCGYQRRKKNNTYFYYKNSNNNRTRKLNRNAEHLHNLFSTAITKYMNTDSFTHKVNSLNDAHLVCRSYFEQMKDFMSTQLSLTNSQLSTLGRNDIVINTLLQTRRDDAIFQIKAWSDFKSEKEFLDFGQLIFLRCNSWLLLGIDMQREIQNLLFPKGVIYDPNREVIFSL